MKFNNQPEAVCPQVQIDTMFNLAFNVHREDLTIYRHYAINETQLSLFIQVSFMIVPHLCKVLGKVLSFREFLFYPLAFQRPKRPNLELMDNESGITEEERTEYEELVTAIRSHNVKELFELIMSNEDIPEDEVSKYSLPAHWMSPPTSIGELAITQLSIWLQQSESTNQSLYYETLAKLVHLSIEYEIIIHLLRLLMGDESEYTLFLFYYLTKNDIFCGELNDKYKEDILVCLNMVYDEMNSKTAVKVLAICCMFQIAANSPQMGNLILEHYSVGEKIARLFKGEEMDSISEAPSEDESEPLNPLQKDMLVRSLLCSLHEQSFELLKSISELPNEVHHKRKLEVELRKSTESRQKDNEIMKMVVTKEKELSWDELGPQLGTEEKARSPIHPPPAEQPPELHITPRSQMCFDLEFKKMVNDSKSSHPRKSNTQPCCCHIF